MLLRKTINVSIVHKGIRYQSEGVKPCQD